ncbi:MAG TPA: T9SS type A sorting domain-containing protein [Balneolales bacterium]|nr:T9SS type A sorting domain-containing protein [Balneolales bacterium]
MTQAQLRAHRQAAPQKSTETAMVQPAATPVAIHQLPFASKNNSLQLSVQNATGNTIPSVTVTVTQAPEWMIFSQKQRDLSDIGTKKDMTVHFRFQVDEQAPVGQTGQVVIQASGPSGKIWEKSIQFKVAAPDHFSLLPNYPNPFNPSTNIHYRLPATMKVTIAIYDILGRKVATLTNGQQQAAGSHLVRWDAHNLASGVYFYRVIAEQKDGKSIIKNSKMLLLK